MAAGAAYATTLARRWEPGWDSAIYLTVAESLARGEGWAYQGFDFVKLPPGFPALLAAISPLTRDDPLRHRIVVVGSAALSVGFAWMLFRRRHGDRAAAALAVLAITSPLAWPELGHVLSDFPALAIVLAGLVAAEDRFREPGGRSWIPVALLAAAAPLFRTSGVMLGAAVALVAVRRGARVPAAVILLAAVAGPAAWRLRAESVDHPLPAELPEASDHVRELRVRDLRDLDSPPATPADLGRRVARQAGWMAGVSGRAVLGSRFGTGAGAVIVILAVLAGLVPRLRRRPMPAEAFFLLHAGVHLLWPGMEPRLLLPLVPFLFLYALGPLFAAIGRRPLILGAAVAVLVALHAPEVGRLIQRERAGPAPAGRRADELATIAWMKDGLAPDAVVIADRGPWCHRLTGRRAFAFPRTDREKVVLASLDRLGATHLFVNDQPHAVRVLRPLVARHPERFREIHRLRSQAVYEIRRDR